MTDFTEAEAAAVLHITEADVLRLLAVGDLALDRDSVLACREKLLRGRPPRPGDTEHSYKVDGLLETNVTVILGDGTGDTVHIVCDGTMLSFGESRWQSARSALNRPDPRGPFPVASVFTVFVHEARMEGPVESQVRASLRVAVQCKNRLAYASIYSTQHRIDLAPVPFVVGDDVVTIARTVFETAACAQ
ncbi:hypothetical protein [Paraburkholderia sp. BL25I1N1]|uniref:hypothetical protein n=1 Tax=Paraburkholderia sp. BL25I1N1 TaxID=1938804 RepID=UPI000D05CF65|nr:hypothetical protein [Paraburkholderia sp. BL25I1N1]PRY05925.1 hypothetical protein B0G73_108177 [Paraburkholderia sp. BL25I1N1]